MTKVLVVDDEPQIRRALGVSLRAHGYGVDLAATGAEAVQKSINRPDAILLDLGLPDIEGIEVIASVRIWSDVPIIVLSVRNDEIDKIDALDAGANDYVTKPFAMGELMARLRVVLRRPGDQVGPPTVLTDDFVIDLASQRAIVDGVDVRLTPTEWAVVRELVKNPGRLVSQRQLLHAVWGPQFDKETNYLRVHLAAIRRKLEPEPSNPVYFVTEHGMGYRFEQQGRRSR